MAIASAVASTVLATLLFEPAASLAAPSAAQTAPPILSDLRSFYEPLGPNTGKIHRIRWVLDVLYYDREWDLLWVESNGFATFVRPDKSLPALRAGQRIQIEGEIVPGGELDLAGTAVAILDTPSRIQPLNAVGLLADSDRFTNHLTTVEAVVERQTDSDPSHLTLGAAAEGLPLVARIQVNPGTERPRLAGKRIRATGVLVEQHNAAGELASIALWVQGLDAVEDLGATDLIPAEATPGARTEARTASIGSPATPPLLTDFHAFYELPTTETGTLHRFRWELDVLYYDREWDLLWVESDGFATFVTPDKSFPPLAAGQRIRIEGEIIPDNGLSFSGASITILDEPSRTYSLDTSGRLADSARFTNHLATVEAVVDNQRLSDPTHLMLEASAQGLHLILYVQVDPGRESPRLIGRNIRATGVFVDHHSFAGDIASIALWVQSLRSIEVLGTLDQDPLFTAPVIRIEQIDDVSGGAPIHIVGTVHSFDNTAATVTLRDATGQVVVSTAQTRDIQIGADLEAVGRPVLTGIQRRLLDAKVRPIRGRQRTGAEPKEGINQPDKLCLADQVLGLSAAKADGALPVQLFGVATWMANDRTSMFIEDITGGVEVQLPQLTKEPPRLPCAVLIEGHTARGSFAPLVAGESIVWSNPLGSPVPHRATLDDLMTGTLHGRWVGLQAYLRQITRNAHGIQLDLTTTTGELNALLPPDARLAVEPGALVSIDGVCCVVANDRHQLAGVRLLVPSGGNIAIEQTAPADPFALPVRSLAAMREFGPAESALHRVCTTGTVVLHEPGRFLCLQDGSDTLLALSRDRDPLQPGDRVEVVGIPGREGSRLVLREAIYRRTGRSEDPAPLELASPEIKGEGLDGRIVRLSGTIVDTHRGATDIILTIEAQKRLFTATLAPRFFEPQRHRNGSLVALRGVYRTVFDEYRQPVNFALNLRTGDDLTVLADPPVWTTRRALTAAAALLFLTATVVAWVAVLRSRVAKQTAQIRHQLEHQKRLETELLHAQRVESLALLAGGIAHDFNNMLTGILVNLSLARMDVRASDAAGGCLADAELATLRARDLTQQLLVFSKGGAPCRSVVALAGVVQESASFALHGSAVRAEFDLASDLWLADVDRVQIAQVVQNLAINAVQAMPSGGLLHITVVNEEVPAGRTADLQAGRYLRLTVRDSGTGIPPERLSKIFDPYFTTKKSGNGLGLATVFTIVRRHGGHIEVESQVGRGTTFRLWLPASDATADAAEPPTTTAPQSAFGAPTTTENPAQARRILVMDDDPIIRRSTALGLLHAGYEPTLTADGHEAIQAFRCAQQNGRPFDLVLLDLTIPGSMGAKDALNAIRRLDAEVVAIVASGHVNDPVFLARREHGFDDALAKPYEVAQLVAIVAGNLKKKRH